MTNTLLKLIFILYSSLIIILESNLIILSLFLIPILYLIIKNRVKIPIKYLIVLIIPIYLLFFMVFLIDSGDINQALNSTFKEASLMILKLLLLVLLNLWFIISTSPLSFLNALKKIKFPNNISIAFLILIGIIPNTLKTIKQIYQAQQLRGFQKRDLLTKKGWELFLVPLFIYIFSYSQQITIQIQLKDYSSYYTDDDNVTTLSFVIFLLAVIITSLVYLTPLAKRALSLI